MNELATMAQTNKGAQSKLRADTYPALRSYIEKLVPDARDWPRVKTRSERLQIGHLIEAVIAWFSVQPTEVQRDVVAKGREVARTLEKRAGISIKDIRSGQTRAAGVKILDGATEGLASGVPDSHGKAKSLGGPKKGD